MRACAVTQWIEPAFTCPDIDDVACLFLVWLVSREVPIQQVGRDVELMFARSDNRYAVLTH
jgi:hypothetical protein